MTKIKMKALTYQSVPQGNDKQFVAKDGEFFVFSEQDALARVERRLAERLSAEAPSDAEAAAAETETTADADTPWTLQISPEAYLEKWPEGPNAAHAKAVLKAKSESGSTSAGA